MRVQPDGLNLLETAARVLKQELISELSGANKYKALMVINAMSVAARQLENGDAKNTELQLQLAHTLDQDGSLFELEKALAEKIRNNELDASGQQLLWHHTMARVKESAPKYLKVENLVE